jgi:hypothetical protein
MAVALDLGGTPVKIGELQAAVEDFTIAQSTEFNQEHDHQGRHTKPFQSLEVEGATQLLGGSILGLMLAFEEGNETTLTANTNDLTQVDGSAIEDVVIRLQSTGDVDLTGIVPADTSKRQVHLIEHGGAGTTITLKHNTTSVYRFALPGEGDVELQSGEVVLIVWDPNSAIWRMLRAGGQGVKSLQRVTITYTSGATSAAGAITAVDLANADISLLGEFFFAGSGSPTLLNHSVLDLINCTSTSIVIKRSLGQDSALDNISGIVVAQVVEYF